MYVFILEYYAFQKNERSKYESNFGCVYSGRDFWLCKRPVMP